MRRRPLLVLLAVLVASAGLHAHRALNPTSSYQSDDERSYGKLAVNIAEDRHYGDRSTRMTEPLRWPPGAPMMFAAAHALFGSGESRESADIPAAYWFQGLAGLGSALAAFGLAFVLAGWWPGVAAGALVGLYPPLILATGEQVSEPLGALLLTAALWVLALALRDRSLPRYAIAGALMGAAVLTRADLILLPFLAAAALWLFGWLRRGEPRRALLVGTVLAGGALVVMAPWILYASERAGRLVPVTQGSAAPLFVGTYLPGGGHTVGMKRALYDEVVAHRPSLAQTPPFEVDAQYYMEMIAARRPELPRDVAIRAEARENLRRYALGQPGDFALMMGDKVQRMWTRYARGGARHTSWVIRGWHIAIVLAALAGLILGIRRGRSLPLAIVAVGIAYSTALHLIVISQARYNLPLMPGLVAGGVAGWALWLRARREPAEDGEAGPGVPAAHAPS